MILDTHVVDGMAARLDGTSHDSNRATSDKVLVPTSEVFPLRCRFTYTYVHIIYTLYDEYVSSDLLVALSSGVSACRSDVDGGGEGG